MKLKRIMSMVLCFAMVLSTMSFPAFAIETDYVAKIGETVYSSFSEAMTDAYSTEGDVEVEIYGSVEFTDGMELKNGSYDTITFIGMADGATITVNQTAGGDYLEAHGKTVAFTDLTLAKANPAWFGNSGHMGNYFSVQGGTATYTDCTFPNGACTSGGTATYTNCTFENSAEYGLWVYDDALVTVDGGTVDSTKGIKVYSEDETSITSTLTVQNATFTENVTAKPAVAVGYAESITLIGNTYNNTTAVIELDSGTDADCNGITFVAEDGEGNDIASTLTVVDRSNSGAACGVLVNDKIYTTATEAAKDAESGDTVTLLYDTTETVEFAEGVTLDTNGKTAENVTVTTPEPIVVNAYVAQDTHVNGWTTVWGQLKINGTENFYIEIYSGETYLGKTTLVDTENALLDGSNHDVTWHAFLDGSDSWWNTEWTVAPVSNLAPSNVKYYVDDVEIGTGVVKMSSADDLNPVVWEELRGVTTYVENAVAYIGAQGYETLGAAIDAVKNGETITLSEDCAETVNINKSGVAFTIDGNNMTYTGKIEINVGQNVSIKNINFVHEDDDALDFIANVGSPTGKNYNTTMTVEDCTFTGNSKDNVVAIRTIHPTAITIKNCEGTGLHSFLQNTGGQKVEVRNVTITESKGGLAIGTTPSVTVRGCDITTRSYGIRLDATLDANVTLNGNTVNAYIPVSVRKATATEYKLNFNGSASSYTATNTDGVWCAICATEYEAGVELNEATGNVKITWNTDSLDKSGVYGAYEWPIEVEYSDGYTKGFDSLASAMSFGYSGGTLEKVVVHEDITEKITSLEGNITTDNPNGVTITNTYDEDEWVYCGYDNFTVGEGVTFNSPTAGLFVYGDNCVIKGTVNTDAYYQCYADSKLTIYEPGSLNVSTETFIVRYMQGDAEAGIYIVGDNNDETIGLNAQVIYFYQGMINAKDANIKVGTYWQTNTTDNEGTASLALNNSKMTVTVNEHNFKATGNSSVSLTNNSALNIAGGFEAGENVSVYVDDTSSMTYNGGTEDDIVAAPVAKIGDAYFRTFAAALNAVSDGQTITLLGGISTDELSKEIDFTKDISFTITGIAPDYALPVVTFQNATVTIEDAEILIPELDARQNATINVVDSIVHDAGGNSIVKSYYNGAINISGTSVVHTMQVTTMGYITVSDTAKLNATWQTNVYGNGLITVEDDATFASAALQLTAKDYSGRDNTDTERVGKPAEVAVDGANLIIGNVKSDSGADYSYNSAYGINIGTIEGKKAVLTAKNGANVNIYMADGEKVNIGADGTVNVADSAFVTACRAADGSVSVANEGTVNVSGTSDIAANVTGAGWVYMDGVTLDADTKLDGAKVRFASGTNNIDGSVIDNGFFQVGVGAYNGVDTRVDTTNGVTVNVKNAVIGAKDATYAGWIGTGFYDTDSEKAAAMNSAKYVLNIENSISEFGYLHVSNDGELNVKGNAANKAHYNNSDYSFRGGDFIINGSATFDATDVLAFYTKVSCDNGTTTPGTINIVNGTYYEAERHNGAVAGTNFILYKTGIANVDESSELYLGEPSSIAADAVMNINGKVTALGEITNNGTINVAEDALLTANGSVKVNGNLKSTGNITGTITKADTAAIEITGGTYTQDVSAWCPNGYICENNGDGTYSVINTTPSAYTVTVKASEDKVRYNKNNTPDTFTVEYIVTGGNVIGAMAQYNYDNALFTCAEDEDNDGKLILYNNDLTTAANGETVIAKLTFTVNKDVEVDTTYEFLAEKVQVTSDYDAAGSGAQDGFVENVVGDEVTVVAQWKVTLPGDNTLAGNTYVDKNTDYSATINNFDENMTYTIKYSMGGGEEQTIVVTKDNDVNNGFVIEDVTGDIVFTDVSYELNCEIVLVPDYVNGCTLVIVKDGVANGYTYDNAPMYPVARYVGLTELPENANQYIVGDILNATSVRAILVEGGLDEAQARALIKASDSEPDDIEKSFDVNGNGDLFFTDAMTAHGCYKEQYDLALELAFYLRADVDTDLKIRTLDYDATVGAILDELYGD